MKRILFLVLTCFIFVEELFIAQQVERVSVDILADSASVDTIFADTVYADTILADSALAEWRVSDTIDISMNDNSLESIFVRLEVKELSLLSEYNRLDLLDYVNCGMKAIVDNCYAGKTELTLKKADYMHLQMSSVSELELFFLPTLKGDTIVGLISTITSPVELSSFRAYTPDGAPHALAFPIPAPHEFVDSNKVDASLLRKMQFLPVRITYSDADKAFVCQLSTKSIPIEDKKGIEKHAQSIRFKWNGEAFQKE
jgi:hypothetical protein